MSKKTKQIKKKGKRMENWREGIEEVRDAPDPIKLAYCEQNGIKMSTLDRALRLGASALKPLTIESYLVTGKRDFEIEEKFGKPVEDVLANIPEGYELFNTVDEHHQPIHVLLPELTKNYEMKEKEWNYRWQPEGQPYLWINMPEDAGKDKIKIVPIADLHEGNQAANMEKFREWVNWIKSRKDVYTFINGDLFENAHGDSNRGVAMYEQVLRPKKQLEQMVDILAPISHKILWAIPGNHEDRSRVRDYDPLEWMCDKLGTPYSYEPIYVDLMWKGHTFTFFCQHGNTGSQTKGGKMNAATRPQKFQEHTMFTYMAHVHDALTNTTVRICRDRVNFKLLEKKQYVIVCPSFLEYFNSYASKNLYEPGAQGTINAELYANGDFHASS